MRGYASQAVIIFHFFAISAVLRSSAFAGIPLAWNSGVDFFFVLSGFLLSIPFIQFGRQDLRNYYVRRAFRILPVYYLSLVGTLLFFTKGATLEQVVTSFFFLQNFFPSTFDSINGVYWTLVIEEIFYATLPVFSYFFLKQRWMYSLPICIAISTAYRVIFYTMLSNNLYYLNFSLWQFPSYIESYAIGATLANFFVYGKIYAGKYSSAIPLILSAALLVVTQFVVGSNYYWNAYNFPVVNIVFALEYGAILYFTLTSPLASKVRSLFTNPVAQFTGKVSYSTYIWHLPIEVTFYSLGLPLLQWIAISYTVSMTIATLSYRYVEKPFLSFRNRFVRVRVKPSKKDEKTEEIESSAR